MNDVKHDKLAKRCHSENNIMVIQKTQSHFWDILQETPIVLQLRGFQFYFTILRRPSCRCIITNELFKGSTATHTRKCHNQTDLCLNARVSIIPGILRLRSHWLPTLATDAALLFLVMLSFILPSPVTLTVNALPAK